MRYPFLASLLLGLAAAPLLAQTFYQSPYTLSQGAQGHYYDNEGTQIHEDTHGVNSLLRRQYGGECFYVGQRRFVRFERFKGFTLASLMQAWRYRGNLFQTFQQSVNPPMQTYQGMKVESWNDQPFYVLDEWVAYTNSAITMVLLHRSGNHASRVEFMLESSYYSYVLVASLPQSYSDRQSAIDFWFWNARRVLKTANYARRTGIHYRVNQDPWRNWLDGKLSP